MTDITGKLARELERVRSNGCVGQVLVSETHRVRVWSIRLAPGERLDFHDHVVDEFWTAVTDGRTYFLYDNGSVDETAYRAGETRNLSFGPERARSHEHRDGRPRLHDCGVPRQC